RPPAARGGAGALGHCRLQRHRPPLPRGDAARARFRTDPRAGPRPRARDLRARRERDPGGHGPARAARGRLPVLGACHRRGVETVEHPLTAGLGAEAAIWFEESPAFEVEAGTVLARYPDSNPLLSGWLSGGERLSGKAALVEVPLGRGRVVLYGFRPQYRAQS